MVQVTTPINLRVKFKKVGSLQYISHLDLVRTMNKIIVRARLPLWYTEGFNPKPKMVFAAPLSIGTESLAEYVDIRLTEKMDPALAMERLNANMTEEMQVIEAYYPENKLTELAWLSYSISIKTGGATAELASKIEETLLSDRVEVEKRAKNGEMKNVDIRPLIKSASTVLDGEYIRLNCILSADPSAFLNPGLVIKALRRECGILSAEDITTEWYSILRTSAHFSDMSEFR